MTYPHPLSHEALGRAATLLRHTTDLTPMTPATRTMQFPELSDPDTARLADVFTTGLTALDPTDPYTIFVYAMSSTLPNTTHPVPGIHVGHPAAIPGPTADTLILLTAMTATWNPHLTTAALPEFLRTHTVTDDDLAITFGPAWPHPPLGRPGQRTGVYFRGHHRTPHAVPAQRSTTATAYQPNGTHAGKCPRTRGCARYVPTCERPRERHHQ